MSFEVIEQKLYSLFQEDMEYTIPDYQRPYTWNTDQASQLYDDIYESYERDDAQYFIGSLVLIKNATQKDHYEIVDGQQRLTTISLLFAAFLSRLKGKDAYRDAQKLIQYYNEAEEVWGDYRIRVREKDKIFYEALLSCDGNITVSGENEAQEKMLQNYSVFVNNLNKLDDTTLAKLRVFIKTKVCLVKVATDNFESAFRLFNVLNARGIPLSNSDLVKNHLFSKSPDNERADVTSAWEYIEETIKISKMDQFFSHLRTAYIGDQLRKTLRDEINDIIDLKIKKNQEKKSKESDANKKQKMKIAVPVIAEFKKSADDYLNILECNLGNAKCKRIVFSLTQLFFVEWIAPLLAFLRNESYSSCLEEFLEKFERVAYQCWIRGISKGKRNQIFYNIIKAINENKPVEELFNHFKENYTDNDELRSCLDSDLYGRPYAKAILFRIENNAFNLDGTVEKTFRGVISIEHIMPQTLGADWEDQAIPEEDHKQWRHKLGNLTLLSGAKNSAASNKAFLVKKTEVYAKRQSKSAFDMVSEICKNDNWNIPQIRERQKKYVDWLCATLVI